VRQIEIEKLVAQGESERLEFKKSTAQLSAAFETVCGFLNSEGGKVLIGVTNDKKIVGQHVTDNTQQEIANEINKLEPHANINIQYLPFKDEKQVIIIDVLPGAHVPYIYNGRAFRRNQSTTIQMSQHYYEQLLIKRGQLNHAWETQPVTDYKIDMLDAEEIYRTIKQAVNANRIPDEALQETIEDSLARLNLIKDDTLLNAAIVLFGKKVLPDYPQCLIKMARFRGTNSLGSFADNQQVYGNAFKILSSASDFIKKHLTTASFFTDDSFERIDKPTLPVLAVREALVNAICHRDYSHQEASIALAIFDDRMEIWNNGKLPLQINVDDLTKKHHSFPRNKIISNVFYNRGLIEKWGIGTNKMIELCKDNYLPEPKFSEYSGGFSVSFSFKESIVAGIQQIAQTAHHIELTLRQKHILEILSKEGKMPVREIKALLSDAPAARTLGDDLSYLKQQGFIDLKGIGRGAKWCIKEKLNK
jgi:ATP-dependent DNA helicase RecG